MLTVAETYARTAGVIYGASLEEIFAPTKTNAQATKARQLAWALCKQDGYSTADIARTFGRNRQTVHHGIKKARAEWARKYTPSDPAEMFATTRNGQIMELHLLGKSYSEIARQIGCSVGTVAGVIYRNRNTIPDTKMSALRKGKTNV